MGHIHTKEGQHDHTASAFIVVEDGPEPKLLLHMHKKLDRWIQFGGHIELDETPWQAIIHEIKEESGYDIDQLELLQPRERIGNLTDAVLHPVPVAYNTHPFDESHFHTDTSFVFITAQEPRHPLTEGESDEIKGFNHAQLAEMGPDDIPENVQTIGLFVLDVCLAQWERVATSEFGS